MRSICDQREHRSTRTPINASTDQREHRSKRAPINASTAGWVLSVTCMPVRIQTLHPNTVFDVTEHLKSKHGCATNHRSPCHEILPGERQRQRVPSENTQVCSPFYSRDEHIQRGQREVWLERPFAQAEHPFWEHLTLCSLDVPWMAHDSPTGTSIRSGSTDRVEAPAANLTRYGLSLGATHDTRLIASLLTHLVSRRRSRCRLRRRADRQIDAGHGRQRTQRKRSHDRAPLTAAELVLRLIRASQRACAVSLGANAARYAASRCDSNTSSCVLHLEPIFGGFGGWTRTL